MPVNDYDSSTKKVNLIPGEASAFLNSIVMQNNASHSTKASESRIRKFGSVSKNPLQGGGNNEQKLLPLGMKDLLMQEQLKL
jgi:hypothetical protein